MTARLSFTATSVIWRYAAIGAVFGLCFPVGAMAMLFAVGDVAWQPTVFDLVAAAHAHSALLYLIDTAPIFLGAFAGFAGVRQDKLTRLNASLEQQVAMKTESLREALRQADKTNSMISHMADHDPLTGLLNRRRMHKEIVLALSHAKRCRVPFSIAFVDLNRFKAINDGHGHDAGDNFLKGFAALLEQFVRETDKVGRWGGDEFLFLLPQATAAQARQFGDRLDDWLGRHSIDIGGSTKPASASIGIASYPEDGADAEALLVLADQDMYRVKRLRAETAGTELEA